MEKVITTDRLILRPFTLSDAASVRALVGNWKVASMLARVSYPYGQDLAEQWIASHPQTRAQGSHIPFAIEKDGALVGCVGLDREDDSDAYEVGYWVGEPYWNQGIATEAARAAVTHAFTALKSKDGSPVTRLTAGHMAENHASGQVLTKLGFRYTAETDVWSEARRAKVHALRMVLKRTNGQNK
ncbi:MAG: GNAT family N-acetyltransferase [Parvibaculum sp.]|nr:GNAT family N-acetyltransferase [Parvibaculum sp.]